MLLVIRERCAQRRLNIDQSEILDRLPPQDEEAEGIVLAAILWGVFVPERRILGRSLLFEFQPQDFYQEWQQELFKGLAEAYRTRVRDERSLIVLLKKRRVWELIEHMTHHRWYCVYGEVIGTGPVAWLCEFLTYDGWWFHLHAHKAHYVRRVKTASRKRRLIRILVGLLKDAYNESRDIDSRIEAALETLGIITKKAGEYDGKIKPTRRLRPGRPEEL